MPFLNQLEPESLVGQFMANPPMDFTAQLSAEGMPTFTANFDVLTTVDASVRRRVQARPLYRFWSRLLQLRTCFVGATVSEYVWLPAQVEPHHLARRLCSSAGRDCSLLVVKDIPCASPLLDASANAYSAAFTAACRREGFVLLEGQALAWVPIDFASADEYLARLSPGRRRDIRRKLRSREALDIQLVPTGSSIFLDQATIDRFYALYLQVHAQSEVHFDLLSADFFAGVFRDPASGGAMFVYEAQGRMIGWNLCFEYDGMLVDKYIGLDYAASRQHNLYVVSWMENLEYARRRGLSRYVAGWTDPAIKVQLGAQLSMTQHAVRPRNALLRWLLRRISKYFESDRSWMEARRPDAAHCS